jgi:hypothetical protein
MGVGLTPTRPLLRLLFCGISDVVLTREKKKILLQQQHESQNENTQNKNCNFNFQ